MRDAPGFFAEQKIDSDPSFSLTAILAPSEKEQ